MTHPPELVREQHRLRGERKIRKETEDYYFFFFLSFSLGERKDIKLGVEITRKGVIILENVRQCDGTIRADFIVFEC